MQNSNKIESVSTMYKHTKMSECIHSEVLKESQCRFKIHNSIKVKVITFSLDDLIYYKVGFHVSAHIGWSSVSEVSCSRKQQQRLLSIDSKTSWLPGQCQLLFLYVTLYTAVVTVYHMQIINSHIIHLILPSNLTLNDDIFKCWFLHFLNRSLISFDTYVSYHSFEYT